MLTLKKGKIFLNDKECNDPHLLFYTLKDLAEIKELVIDINQLTTGKQLKA